MFVVEEYAFAVVVAVVYVLQDQKRAEFGQFWLLHENKEIFEEALLEKISVEIQPLLAEDEGEGFDGFVEIVALA